MVIHGSRSSNDIKRSWDRFATTARQNLSRNWQNGRLWWNDPDVVLLTGDLNLDEFRIHTTAVFATGGMLLSGDDLTKINEDHLTMLKKLQPPMGVAAQFVDDTMRVGINRLPDREFISVFNPDNLPRSITFPVPNGTEMTDFWTGRSLGLATSEFELKNMPAHSARLFVCT